ncbi:MAG: ribosome silencing factor [Oscillospiraceae bacterium]|nr:ribosome silencing factor [Oscillospiraceae bacterium]MBR6207609.1 ribosome silencing factor [Oscillospiraceae bacterium]
MLNSHEIASLAVKALDDKHARDIQILKTDKVTVLADYFILCTAGSSTHGKTLADEVDKVLSEAGEPPIRREGYRSGGWTLLDFGCVIVHIFSEEMREFYSLDRLWSDAEKLSAEEMLK